MSNRKITAHQRSGGLHCQRPAPVVLMVASYTPLHNWRKAQCRNRKFQR